MMTLLLNEHYVSNLDLYWLQSDRSTDPNKYCPYEFDQHGILCDTVQTD